MQKKRTTRAVSVVLVTIVAASLGCGSSLGTGVTVGGVSFGVLKGSGVKDAEKWAAAIAVGTYVASEVVQREVERRRAEHERESEYLDSEIAAAESKIEERETELKEIERELDRHAKVVDDLEKRRRDDAVFKERSRQTLTDLDALIKRLEEEREVAEAEIEIYTEAVRSSEGKADDSVTEAELQERRTTLLAKRDERLRQYKLVVARGETARALRQRVVNMNQ